MKLYSIDGNIGSGKSSIIQKLRNTVGFSKDIIFVKEPVDEWQEVQDKDGINIISKFYSDRTKWSFAFQMMAFISRTTNLKRVVRDNPDAIIITERNMQTDRDVFAKMLYDAGDINEIEFIIYNKWFDELVEEFPLAGIVYINTSPRVCLERIYTRNRAGETIPEEYIESCNTYHNVYVSQFKNVLKINGDISNTDHDEYNRNIEDIMSFILV